jgi:hypothetical protein
MVKMLLIKHVHNYSIITITTILSCYNSRLRDIKIWCTTRVNFVPSLVFTIHISIGEVVLFADDTNTLNSRLSRIMVGMEITVNQKTRLRQILLKIL